MDAEALADQFSRVLRHDLKPDTMIMAHPEGTWLLRRGKEPVLLGEETDFDSIWQGVLLGH